MRMTETCSGQGLPREDPLESEDFCRQMELEREKEESIDSFIFNIYLIY